MLTGSHSHRVPPQQDVAENNQVVSSSQCPRCCCCRCQHCNMSQQYLDNIAGLDHNCSWPPHYYCPVHILPPGTWVPPDVAVALLLALVRPNDALNDPLDALHYKKWLQAHLDEGHRRSASYGTPGSEGIDPNKLVNQMPPTYQLGGHGGEGVLKWKDPPHPAFVSPRNTQLGGGNSGGNVVVTSSTQPHHTVPATTAGAAPTVTTTSYLKPTSVPYQQPHPNQAAAPTHHLLHPGSSHNGGEHSSSSSGSNSSSLGATDDKELGAYWEILDREIRPLPPLANSPDSQQIFSDHKEMARNYLVLQQELFNLRKCKSDLEGKLSEAEQLEQMNNHRYQDKIRQLEGKRESLRNNHKHLRQQLEHIRSQAARANHPPP